MKRGRVALACALAAWPSEAWREPVTGMEFVHIPAGVFTMGSPGGESGREEQERLHEVTISRPFHLGRFEVTQGQWRRVMDASPSHFADGGDESPVEGVSWADAEEFLRRLAVRSPGGRFRLPTEAEWEYACRAGSSTAYATGETLTLAQANYQPPPGTRAAAPGRTVRVGSYAANAWGLHDMHGNVWEWTADDHCPYPDGRVTDPRGRCGGLKVIRGGSWYFGADSARCALRYTHRAQDRGFSLGFRVVHEISSGGQGGRP